MLYALYNIRLMRPIFHLYGHIALKFNIKPVCDVFLKTLDFNDRHHHGQDYESLNDSHYHGEDYKAPNDSHHEEAYEALSYSVLTVEKTIKQPVTVITIYKAMTPSVTFITMEKPMK